MGRVLLRSWVNKPGVAVGLARFHGNVAHACTYGLLVVELREGETKACVLRSPASSFHFPLLGVRGIYHWNLRSRKQMEARDGCL